MNLFINNICNISEDANSALEIEMRLLIDGRKSYDVNSKLYSRDQTIDLAKKIINKYKDKPVNISQTINFIKGESVKQLVFIKGEQQKDKQNYYSKKQLIHPIYFIHDNNPGYRLSINKETKIDEFPIKEVELARIRLRYTIQLEDWQFDITLIKNIKEFSNPALLKNEKNKMLFDINTDNFINAAPWLSAEYIEFELEYTGSISTFNINKLLIADELFNNIIESNDYQNIIYEIAKYIKPDQAEKFKSKEGLKQLSNQVIELDKHLYLTEVANCIKDYYITDKVDGKRCIIYINDNKIYAVSNTLTIIDAPTNFDITQTYIFDTEFYNNSYYIFDVMVFKDEIISELIFEKRLEYFERASKISDIFKLKPFIKLNDDYKNQIKEFKKQEKIYEIDGIILTPYNGKYNNMQVYKYKPVEKLTVDFLIKKCPESLLGIKPYIQDNNSLYLLFCGINNYVFQKFNMSFIKNYNDIFRSIDTKHPPAYFPIQFQPSNYTYAYLFWSDADNLDGEIGEFLYKDKAWVLNKIRDDRKIELQRGNYFGNNYKVAELIWNSYKNPLIIEELSDESEYFQQHDNQLQKASRNFNSFVKSKIFEQFKYTNWIIDLASGKGQDLFRYGLYGNKNVVFLEIDNAALFELLYRKYDFVSHEHKGNMNIITHQLDINNDYKKNIDILNDITIPNEGVDLIVCNFAFHYFIADKKRLLNVIKFINHYLKNGGRFIFTAFDGKDIIKLLNENNGNWTIKQGESIKYSIKKQYDINMLQDVGQKIDILLPFSNDNYYTEYLVNIDYIAELCQEYNIILETDQSFSEYLESFKKENKKTYDTLDDNDKKYVGLYHYYCLYKKKAVAHTGGRKRFNKK
jgi:SAM-dependent methyltransferase